MQKEPSISELENKLKDMVGPSGGLQEVRWVNPYVNLLNETKYPEGHDFLLQALMRSTVNSKIVYDKFANIGGLEFLGKLIKDYDKSEEPEAKSLLHTIIACLNKFTISVELLETTKIGKALGGLLKHPDVSIQNKSGALIKNWKDILLAPSESARPPKPNYNETKIEIPKRQKVEEDIKQEESAEYIIEQYNEIDDYSNKHVRYVNILSELSLIVIDGWMRTIWKT
ncbi:unnamed protein product [Blepharisma stoltei]|uniref:TFIIS N-terminal domain-containing protein n=1 Tax=Blepharisma stoltei TaxID=1481888 RepID=A0AAU9JSC1_9CILI|nr:unnamed protein product [Blepharisma stoltei]